MQHYSDAEFWVGIFVTITICRENNLRVLITLILLEYGIMYEAGPQGDTLFASFTLQGMTSSRLH